MVSSVSGNNHLLKYYSIFLVAIIFAVYYLDHSNIIVEDLSDYLLYCFILVSLITLVFLAKRKEQEIITISDGFVFINKQDGKSKENLKLSCNEIKFFETKFNEIIFYDANNEKLSIKLDGIRCDKKRWEIKQLLRQHVPENRSHRHMLAEQAVDNN